MILEVSSGGRGFGETGSHIDLKKQAKELPSGHPVNGDMAQTFSTTAHQKDRWKVLKKIRINPLALAVTIAKSFTSLFLDSQNSYEISLDCYNL